jgi:hypothetical protein
LVDVIPDRSGCLLPNTSTMLVNTGIAANNTVSGENIALEPFGILKKSPGDRPLVAGWKTLQ